MFHFIGSCEKVITNAEYLTSHTSSQMNVSPVRFQVLATMSTETSVFWDVAPCSLANTDVSEEGLLAATFIREVMRVAVRTSEKSVGIYLTTRRSQRTAI